MYQTTKCEAKEKAWHRITTKKICSTATSTFEWLNSQQALHTR